MIWALISKFQDILSLIGLGTILYWTVKATSKAVRWTERTK